jgi:hypothetical protein
MKTCTLIPTRSCGIRHLLQFNIYDSGGNGICCGTSGLGRYQLKSGSGIIKGGAAFGSEDHVQFYSGAGVGIPEAAYPFAFSIYPNPTTSMATLTIENSAPANLEVRVLNMQGSELQRIRPRHMMPAVTRYCWIVRISRRFIYGTVKYRR